MPWLIRHANGRKILLMVQSHSIGGRCAAGATKAAPGKGTQSCPRQGHRHASTDLGVHLKQVALLVEEAGLGAAYHHLQQEW